MIPVPHEFRKREVHEYGATLLSRCLAMKKNAARLARLAGSLASRGRARTPFAQVPREARYGVGGRCSCGDLRASVRCKIDEKLPKNRQLTVLRARACARRAFFYRDMLALTAGMKMKQGGT